MSLPVLPNPSNLVAVALVVNRTRDGANLVFHYPPEASVDHVASPPGSPEGDLGQNDMILERLSQNQSKSQGGGFHAGRGLDGRFAPTAVSGAAAPWETVTGFPASDLATLLSPGRPYHKTLFQVSLDPLHYVSCPVHVPENGIWKRKPSGLKSKSKVGSSLNLQDLEPSTKPRSDAPPAEDAGRINSGGSLEAKPAAEEGDKDEMGKKGEKGEKAEKVSSMTMFNIVFILNPKQHEVGELVNGLHSNIIKKVNKALKYCQQRFDFVWKESKQIIRDKEKAREQSTRYPPSDATVGKLTISREAHGPTVERAPQGLLPGSLHTGDLPVPGAEQDHQPHAWARQHTS